MTSKTGGTGERKKSGWSGSVRVRRRRDPSTSYRRNGPARGSFDILSTPTGLLLKHFYTGKCRTLSHSFGDLQLCQMAANFGGGLLGEVHEERLDEVCMGRCFSSLHDSASYL